MTFRLFFFIEGDDEQRFFQKIVIPLFKRKYPRPRTVKYSQMKPEDRIKLVKSIKKMGADYIYVQDIEAPCVTASKDDTVRILEGVVERGKIAVVIKEIECWYLCGLTTDSCREIGVRESMNNTETFAKKKFNNLIPKGMPRPEFLQRILDKFDTNVGKNQNQSFRHFLENWEP